MKRFMIAALAAASLLAACGGGDSGTNGVTAVKVVGASLADSGTFGFKFTVQPGPGLPAYQVYPERVASAYGLPALCAAYRATGPTTFAVASGCTNHAVAGAGINFGRFSDANSDTVDDTFTALPTVPWSQLFQLEALGAQGFAWGDLLIVGEGSANDTATLVTAYLTDAQTAGSLDTTLFRQVITSLMNDGGTVAGAGVLAVDGGLAAGTTYMQQLARTLVASVRTNAIQQGARRVLILNTLDVTRTPRFEAILAGMGETQATNVRNLVRAWINAYNTALVNESRQLQGRVEVFDFYSVFNTQLANPSQYGLTNLAQTVCDETYAESSSYTPSLATAGNTSLNDGPVRTSCTDTYASSITPSVGTGTTWWTTYLFADNFHPTPRGHELLGTEVNQRLRQLGWL
ncbi:SGNH/GDSL hydrolase family protein [Aquabacterium sp.]|uniref:SGNH/GDSL hydrolase family protein n=1 Tax=Aquabacterium sp. TaxID=1872578 RepID=UPI003BB08415